MDDAVDAAQLAMLYEVAGTPKPGNVDRHRDLASLRFDRFLAGAVGSRAGLARAASGEPVGSAFEQAVAGMARLAGTNTQFGSLLLLVPLVRTTRNSLSPAGVDRITRATTVDDAVAFYRAFEHVDVAVGDPPAEAPELDVNRGADAIADLKARDLTLREVLALGVPGDDVAREWVTGFERSFAAAETLSEASGPIPDRVASTYLSALAERPDTLVATRHGDAVAEDVRERAASLLERDAFGTDRAAVDAFATELADRGINPGTTADVIAAGCFISLYHGRIEP